MIYNYLAIGMLGVAACLLLSDTTTITRLWQRFLLWSLIASGKQLFGIILTYSPKVSDESDEHRVVVAITFSKDQEYVDKIVEATDG